MAGRPLSTEIIKLMDKIAENPNSRLFVPLAEEYQNNDMTDEAIHVLNDGIEKHPTYVAARIMLGKIYLSKNQTIEAKVEFEHVIEINPDNILAHKKLALIYQEEGEPQRAVEAYKQILTIDPSDKESKTLLEKLEGETSSDIGPEMSEPTPGNETPFELESTPLKASPDTTFDEVEDILLPDAATSTNPDLGSYSSSEMDLNQAGITPSGEPEVSEDENRFDLREEVKPDPGFVENDGQIGYPPEPPSQMSTASPESNPQEMPATNSLAALYVDQGCYQEAVDIYKECLERDPTDQESRDGLELALQKLSEEASAEALPSPDLIGEPEGDSSEKGQTERLQVWLDAIQKNRKKI